LRIGFVYSIKANKAMDGVALYERYNQAAYLTSSKPFTAHNFPTLSLHPLLEWNILLMPWRLCYATSVIEECYMRVGGLSCDFIQMSRD
jgi:hypothetical protein